MKYQFCIRFDEIDVNSSASKAVLDCNIIFSALGYRDYTLTVPHNRDKKKYYIRLISELIRFFRGIRSHSIIGIQYPLLSINKVFRYFIKLARWKHIRFFCVVHDIESLRTGGKDEVLIRAEVAQLNAYDVLIVHNPTMQDWLQKAGVTQPMFSLTLFDYLTDKALPAFQPQQAETINYAGNLAKSLFIYQLPVLKNHRLTVFGPGFAPEKLSPGTTIKWGGVFSPEQIVAELKGGYGLIWDGTRIDGGDTALGNYLNYNNPHKASLYLAAGLPLIAPRRSAIGKLITERGIGVLIDTLYDLDHISTDASTYQNLQANVLKIRPEVISGIFFTRAVQQAEQILLAP